MGRFETQAEFAKAIGRSQSSVNEILKNGRRVPAEWCIPIEQATNGEVTRTMLREDLYPREDERAA